MKTLSIAETSGESDLMDVVISTKAVVFLGTPHRGSSDMANVGEVARRVASALMIDTNPAILDSLGLRNSDLERSQDAFSRLWAGYDFTVKTFQEGLAVTGIGIGLLNEKACLFT